LAPARRPSATAWSSTISSLPANGYQGGITVLKEFVAGFLPEKRDDPVVRYETEPGQQMQVDILRSGDRVPGIIGF